MALPDRRVLVTFSASSSFLSSDNWSQIHAALLSQLPLRNIHWKSASRPSIRTIQQLDITLIPLDTPRDEHTSQIPVTLLEKPFLNIYIVTCEDIDVETYRSAVKKQIKDWHAAVTTRKNQEWLILHVIRPDARTPSGNFFQLKGSVFDKIKADFNSDKRERCVQLTWSTGYDNPAAWAELINKIKDGLLSAFDSAVIQREEEVRRSESQRQMPGWNFCTFFILKESVAISFEGLNLFEDALIQYDELEASFYQVLKEKNLSWFGTLITPGPKDDSLSLLTISKKPYRELILANTISVFDFRIYLLARQCDLLAKMGRINEVCRKAGAFLGAFGRRLRDVEASIPHFFVESWIHSSALSVVHQCDAWAADFTMEGSRLATFNAGKGELLELARNQLDIIGIEVGHLPSRPPFSLAGQKSSSTFSNATPNHSSLKISNLDILTSLDNRETFYELYISLTNRAIDMYVKAARRKFALKLHGSLAALDVHRGRLAAALTTYRSLPAHYAPHMWTSLESLTLSLALDTYADLNKAKDKEWIHIVLAFLKTCTNHLGTELLVQEEDKVSYISQLVAAMRDAACELDSDIAHLDHPALSIRVSNDARIAGTQDGSFLDVTIHNHLPCAFPVDEVSVILGGRDSERIMYTSRTASLVPGSTELTLFCPTPSSGTYILDFSEVQMSRLHFHWTHRIVSSPGRAPVNNNSPVLVRIPRDLLALDVRLRQPKRVELGRLPTLLIAVSSGRNHISKATIKLTAPGVTYYCQDAILEETGSARLEAGNEFATVSDVAKDKIVAFLMPYSDASASQTMKVNIDVEYVTVSEPSTIRRLFLTRVIVTSLPVVVNVEDFFRGTRLFSKFMISTTSHQHVRISSVQLEGPAAGLDGAKIVGCSAQKRGLVTVTPTQPANFLFYLDSSDGPVRKSLSLLIKYCMLREEVESLIERCVERIMMDLPSSLPDRATLIDTLLDALERDATWVEMYEVTGELKVPRSPDEEKLGETIGQVKKLLEGHKHEYPPLEEWHQIRIPVDVPCMNIVAAAQVRILSPTLETETSHRSPQLYAGQPVSAILSIHTSFHWGTRVNDQTRSYMMRFDVEEMVREWLVSGRKRGDFTAKDDATYTVPLTLIALHHGELALPKVAVTALPVLEDVTMGSTAIPSTETYQAYGAERVLVLPRGGRSTYVVGMGSN